LNLSSVSDAKFEHLTKCQKANIHKAFCYANLVKSPTRLPEDPEFNFARLTRPGITRQVPHPRPPSCGEGVASEVDADLALIHRHHRGDLLVGGIAVDRSRPI
jgi:hypothetical protein